MTIGDDDWQLWEVCWLVSHTTFSLLPPVNFAIIVIVVIAIIIVVIVIVIVIAIIIVILIVICG